jgi:hypothetical protein
MGGFVLDEWKNKYFEHGFSIRQLHIRWGSLFVDTSSELAVPLSYDLVESAPAIQFY